VDLHGGRISAVIKHALLSHGVLARVPLPCHSAEIIPPKTGKAKVNTNKSSKKDKAGFGKDRRRKHHHWLVTVYYADGEKFGRVYTDRDKATRFAVRQRRSPVVKAARITQVS
jgi:hypothetical protein